MTKGSRVNLDVNDYRPKMVAAPGPDGFWVAMPEGGYCFVRSKLVHVEMERMWPDLQLRDDKNKPLSAVELYRAYGERADQTVYTYLGASRYAPGHGGGGTLHVRPFWPTPVKAVQHEDVEEWLKIAFCQESETILDWLATLDQLDRPTGALFLIGGDSIGKSMIASACARYFGSSVTKYDDVFKERFNDALLRSPIVHLDEKTQAKSKSAGFRQLTANRVHAIEAKNMPSGTLHGCPRLVVTANNGDPTELSREALTAADERAIGKRVVMVQCNDAAREWMEDRGNWDLTGDWIELPDGEAGRLVEHIAWLVENREVQTGGRFLVQGDSNGWAQSVGSRAGLPSDIIDAIQSWREMTSDEKMRLDKVPFFDTPMDVLVSVSGLIMAWPTFHGCRAPSMKAMKLALDVLSDQRPSFRPRKIAGRPRVYPVARDKIPAWTTDEDGSSDADDRYPASEGWTRAAHGGMTRNVPLD